MIRWASFRQPNLQYEIILMIVFHIKLIYDIGLNKTGIAYMQSL